MSLGNELSPADIRACTENNCNGGGSGMGWGGNWSEWILVFLIFAVFGWGGNGGFGGFGGGSAGAAQNYVLNSDFATLQRQLSDGFNSQERRTDSIINGICDLGYTQQSLANGVNQNVSNGFYNTLNAITTNGYENRLAINTLSAQNAQCCCDIKGAIGDVKTQSVFNTNAIQQDISGAAFNAEKTAMQTRFDMAQYNCNTLSAIDKVGDRIIDYMANKEAQALRDENQALRLAASQQAQNAYLISELGYKCPQPAYVVQPPAAGDIPY